MEAIIQQRKNSLAPVQYKELYAKEVDVDVAGRKVSGYLAIFGVKDSDDDILLKGCFAKSIQERGPDSDTNRKIAFVWQHDMKDPIGRFTTLKEDNIGLYFEAVIDEGVPSADRALLQMKSGTLNQFSFGYRYVWDKCEWDNDLEALIVKEVVLYEGSVVTAGANEWTFFAGMKGERKQQESEKLITETEELIKLVPKEHQYALRQLISKHIAIASSTEPPVKALKTEDDPPPAFDLSAAIQQTTFIKI